MAQAVFDRMWLTYAYFVVTLIVCVQAIFQNSFLVGAPALLACAICFFAAATFAASFRARRELNHTGKHLAGIGAAAGVIAAVGIAIIAWSGFWVGLFGLAIDGPYWALIGLLIALVATKKEMAF